MTALRKTRKGQTTELRQSPDAGTRTIAAKNQSYSLPLPLWQDLVDEVARRRRMGLEHASQNSVAVAAITLWLEQHKGGE